MTISDHRDLVAALLGVPGVAAATVEPLGGGPGTLRLQLASGADEVDVAGAVNRLLRSRFGLAVDTDRVRVLEATGPGTLAGPGVPPARLPDVLPPRPANGRPPLEADPAPAATPVAEGPESAASPGHGNDTDSADPADTAASTDSTDSTSDLADQQHRPAGTRMVIERVQLVSAALGVSVAVTLRAGMRTGVGETEGAATTAALHRSVAAATLRAVEVLVGQAVRFDVEHVEIASTGEERTALVVVSMLTERTTQRLSGASVVREDVRQAVIRGVLAAVNRRVEPMLGEVAG